MRRVGDERFPVLLGKFNYYLRVKLSYSFTQKPTCEQNSSISLCLKIYLRSIFPFFYSQTAFPSIFIYFLLINQLLASNVFLFFYQEIRLLIKLSYSYTRKATSEYNFCILLLENKLFQRNKVVMLFFRGHLMIFYKCKNKPCFFPYEA